MTNKIIAALLGFAAAAAHASGLDALDHFMQTAKSGRANFTQVVTAPSRQGQPGRTRTSTGTFEFSRPSKFRFDYQKPFQQQIVADGHTLWIYDADLNQVTARGQTAVLASTPAALIASARSTAELVRYFTLEAGNDQQDGLQWAVATPKNRDGQLNSMRVGFRGDELAKLVIVDGFGQKSVITFEKIETNVAIPPETFHFTPPKGATVLKE